MKHWTTMDTPEKVVMGILDLAITSKKNINNLLVSGIVPKFDKFNQKASEVSTILRNECKKKYFTNK